MSLNSAERAAGLDAALPAGERILWQAKPRRRAFTRSVFHARLLLGYCGGAALLVLLLALHHGRPLGQAVAEATLLIPLALIAFALLGLVGRACARASTYTLTNRRLILHIGVAYEMTVSIPLSAITGAALRTRADGSGEIALRVKDMSATNYIALWPHARAWHWFPPQPMLRGLDTPEAASEAIGDALLAFNAGNRRPLPAAAPVPAPAAIEAVAA